jgi:hypothetical protein
MLDIVERYIERMKVDDSHSYHRTLCYIDAARNKLTIDHMQFDYEKCLRHGNLAWFLCAEHIDVPMPFDPKMIKAALHYGAVLFATYMRKNSRYSMTYCDYDFLSHIANHDLREKIFS